MEHSQPLDDRAVVKAILLRNQQITQQYLYVKCYPLFKAVFDNYYTDCQSCLEFINEIYLHLMTPDRTSGLCKLQSFRFGSTLTTWLKTIAVYYCYAHFRRRRYAPIMEQKTEKNGHCSDRFDQYAASIYEEGPLMSRSDIETLLNLMPNKRYAAILRLRYIECMTNEEVAAALRMSMDNFYNKHMRAKKQFYEVLKRENNYGNVY